MQQQGAAYVGKLVADGKVAEGDPLHTALHAILACAGAAASSQACASGAAGAAASGLLASLFAEAGPDETAVQREEKRNIASLVTGMAAAGGVDAVASSTAAISATDNNWLATKQRAQMNKELAAAKGTLDELRVLGKWALVSSGQDLLTMSGVGKGLAESGWSDVKGMAEFLDHPIDGLAGLASIISDPQVRQQIGESAFRELGAKKARMQTAIEVGGTQNAEQLGKDLGALIWQVGSVATGVGGVAKGGAVLAKTGVHVATAGLKTMASIAKFDLFIAKGGIFTSTGKPLSDFKSLTLEQQAILADDTRFLMGETDLPKANGIRVGSPEVPHPDASPDMVRSIQRQN